MRRTDVVAATIAGGTQQVLAVQRLAIELVPGRKAPPVWWKVGQALGQQRDPEPSLMILQQVEHATMARQEAAATVAFQFAQHLTVTAQQAIGGSRPIASAAVGQHQCRTQAGAVGPGRSRYPILRIDAIQAFILCADPYCAIGIAAQPQHADGRQFARRHDVEGMAVPTRQAGFGSHPQPSLRVDQAAVDRVARQSAGLCRIMLEMAQRAVFAEAADPMAAAADP
ncbi:hypothetical protein D3C73_953420 [compost metagenome]